MNEVPKEWFFSNEVLPGADKPFLSRPRLQRILDQALQSPLVTVVAGAGYGKTLSVYEYLRNAPYKIVWLHLSERDNNSWRFWENYVRAVAFFSPEIAVRLAANGFPETKEQFDRFALIPYQDLNPDIKFVFVFDDFHLIQRGPVLRFLEQALNTAFRNVNFIVISRKEPAINTINFLSKGLLTKITEKELRFTQEEMLDYFRLEGITLPEEVARDLYRDTEGWAFAIHLAGLALKKGADDYGRSSFKLDIFNRIEQEIFSAVSPDMQKHLIKFSLVEHLPLKLLISLSGDRSLIDELERIGSFIRYDPYLAAYRIHPLFLEYLNSKQERLTEQEKHNVYVRAGQWCEDNGQKMDAIAYYEKAGAYDKLMEVVYTLPQALPEPTSRFLLSIMERAPEELYRKSPRASILHTRLLFSLGRLEEAEAEAQRLIAEYEALPPSVHKSWVLYGSYNNLGFVRRLQSPSTGNYDFPRFFENAYHHYRLSGVEIRGVITAAAVGSYACRVGAAESGEIEKYLRAAAAAEGPVVASMNGCTSGLSDLARTEVAYFKGNLDEAIQCAYRALYQSQKRNQYEIESRTLLYFLRLSLARGKLAKIGEFFHLLEAQLQVPEYTNRFLHYDVVSGWFYAHIGKTGKIASWILEGPAEGEENFLAESPEVLVRIKGHIAEKQYAAALAVLEEAQTSYGLGAFLLGKLEMKVLEAVCLHYDEKPEAALAALEAAYGLAMPNALDMPFIEQGNDLRPLILAALKDENPRVPRPWLETILKSASAYAKKSFAIIQKYREHEPAPHIFLSSRERKVLIGLSQGFTREEIAEDGALSLNTVKTTISTLYDKLGAVNRADAIRIATAQGILKVE
ncbi:MAG: LuxR C-terminal-related transcriptional regulator [Spirochaetaceae bacterium]|jgi:LuxR family maltose regulon positive regulatory protein|nr:LuxR C-terminal-related transcriptional regulator [Spirochaetaceae bacterium]